MKKSLVFYGEKIVDNKYTIVGYHNFPEQLSEEERNQPNSFEIDGFFPEYTDLLPEAKIAIPYCNPEIKEIWYELGDRPLNKEEIMEERIIQLEQLVADLASLQLGV